MLRNNCLEIYTIILNLINQTEYFIQMLTQRLQMIKGHLGNFYTDICLVEKNQMPMEPWQEFKTIIVTHYIRENNSLY